MAGGNGEYTGRHGLRFLLAVIYLEAEVFDGRPA